MQMVYLALLKLLGKAKTGADNSSTFNLSNACCWGSFHWNLVFPVISYNGPEILAKSLIL
jgi:hypothetical protein